jgi:selenocysteine lyase/cysteine desulfurase
VEIGKLSKKNNILLSVDGIQGIGALTLDAKKCGIDFLSNGGHKWLMGPQGCGFMYLAPELIYKLRPAFVGWLSVKDSWNFFDYRLDFLDDASRFEIGTMNAFGITGLRASTELLLEAGIEKIQNHLLDLGNRLIEGMRQCGYTYIGSEKTSERSGIYSFNGPDPINLIKFLQERNVHLSLRNDVIRFAPHFYNTHDEIDEVIGLCEKFIDIKQDK